MSLTDVSTFENESRATLMSKSLNSLDKWFFPPRRQAYRTCNDFDYLKRRQVGLFFFCVQRDKWGQNHAKGAIKSWSVTRGGWV